MTEPFETRLQTLAQGFDYPATPPVSEKVMEKLSTPIAPRRFFARRLAQGIMILVILLAGLAVVPSVRAAVLEFIQIGIVRIFPPGPTIEAPITALPLTATPAASQSPSLIPFLEQVAGETALAEVRARVSFAIPIPAYPADLGQPDRVFLQDMNGWMVVLVWLDKQNPSQVRLSLHLIEESSWVIEKSNPAVIEQTTVNGQRAVWTEGEYPLILRNSDIQFTRLMNGHVLIWSQAGITYRIETNLSLDESVRIAESLQYP